MNHESIWEAQHFINFDVIIIGAGLTGLATAISLLEARTEASKGILPNVNLKVAILERLMTPSGASSKNAGFALFTEFTEFLDDIKNMGEQKAVEIIIKRYEGHAMLIKRLLKLIHGTVDANNKHEFLVKSGFEISDSNSKNTKTSDLKIGHLYSNNGFYEIISSKEEHTLKQIDYANKLLFPHFKKNIFRRCDHKIKEFGFDAHHVKGIVETAHCGSIDSGGVLRLLTRYASYLGASFYTNTKYIKHNSVFNSNRNLEVHVQGLPAKGFSSVRKLMCDKIVFCTNSFTKEYFPEEKIVPGRGQIFLTKPIPRLNLNGTFGFDEGYYYFKNIGKNQILIGGGRNEDFKAEETFEFGNSPKIIGCIQKRLALILGVPLEEIKIERKWSGIMAFSPDKSEYRSLIVKKHSPHVFIAARLGGMGISISSMVGQEMASQVLRDLKVKAKL
jgi:glycine/D-amino acid oxidase-like deaminating enzyme